MLIQKLQTLILSFNPLGDGVAYPLVACLEHLPSLRALFVEACELTDRALDGQLSIVLKIKQLTEFGIGWNSLQYKLKPWVEAMDLSRVERLSLSGLQNCKTVSVLVTCLQVTGKSGIFELDLSNCNITESCISALTDSFDRLLCLKRLVLKNNPKLQISSLLSLLSACRRNSIYIEDIDLTGCALECASVDSDPGEALQSFLVWSTCLHRLALSFHPRKSDPSWIQSIIDAWTMRHNGDGQSKRMTDHCIILSTSKSLT